MATRIQRTDMDPNAANDKASPEEKASKSGASKGKGDNATPTTMATNHSPSLLPHQFLVNIMDPCFKLGPRVEDDIMNMLQVLKYPFSLSKSMLQAIGSRLSLALGVLTWLLDIMEYYESLNIFDHLFTDDAAAKDTSQVSINQMSILMQYSLQTFNSSEDTSAEDEKFLHALAEEVHGKMESADELREETDRVLKEVQKREAHKDEYITQLEAIAENRARLHET